MKYRPERHTEEYADLISLPHPDFPDHPRMSRKNRAAQFAPFAALTGYDSMVEETARTVGRKEELSGEQEEALNRRLQLLDALLPQTPQVRITFYEPDARKNGGSYRTLDGMLKRIDPVEGVVLLRTGETVPIAQISRIESPVFRTEEETD